MDSLLRQKLTQLTSKCEVLQKNSKYNQCIDIMQQVVSIKKSVYGIDHPQFQKASQKLCQYLNLSAMVNLHKQNFQLTLDALRKAQLVAGKSITLKATTYNNLACYYRRTGKARTALSYLIQALELQLKLQNPRTLSDTHLNLCAVLSQLDRHQDALQHSMLSIILIQDQFLQVLLPKNQDQIVDQRLAVLAIAYHNMGVQFEHLKRFDQALKIYKKALKFSKQNLSQNEQLVRNLTKVVNSATEQIQEQKRLINQSKAKVKDIVIDPKKDLYKSLSKQVDRYRHLPKLRVHSKGFGPNDSQNAYHSIEYGSKGKFELSQEYTINPGRTLKTNDKKTLPSKYTTKVDNIINTPESRAQMDSQLKFRNIMMNTMRQPFTNHDKQTLLKKEPQP